MNAALKHVFAYNAEAGRGSTNFNISAHDVQDTYLPSFEAPVVQSDAKGYMCAYSSVNGEPGCGNKFLKHTFRDEWNFTGCERLDTFARQGVWTLSVWSLFNAHSSWYHCRRQSICRSAHSPDALARACLRSPHHPRRGERLWRRLRHQGLPQGERLDGCGDRARRWRRRHQLRRWAHQPHLRCHQRESSVRHATPCWILDWPCDLLLQLAFCEPHFERFASARALVDVSACSPALNTARLVLHAVVVHPTCPLHQNNNTGPSRCWMPRWCVPTPCCSRPACAATSTLFWTVSHVTLFSAS